MSLSLHIVGYLTKLRPNVIKLGRGAWCVIRKSDQYALQCYSTTFALLTRINLGLHYRTLLALMAVATPGVLSILASPSLVVQRETVKQLQGLGVKRIFLSLLNPIPVDQDGLEYTISV
jgi:hypothetical protein